MQGSKAEQYLSDRWQSQRNYYSKRLKEYKRWHQSLLFISTIGALVVPVLLSLKLVPILVPIIISLLVSAALAIDTTFHFGDNWRDLRQTLEALKQEKVLYEYNISPYDNPQTAFPLFVQRCEDIMGTEVKNYLERHKPQEQVVNIQSKKP